MMKSDSTYGSITNDIALEIASSLEVSDLSSLSCCSRVWREICGSDWLWEPLFKERWPLLYQDVLKDPNFKDWRGFYLKQHKEMKDQAESVVKFVEECLKRPKLLKIKVLMKASKCLQSMRFGFKDVQKLMLKPKLNVLLNLLGLYYSIFILRKPVSVVMEALESSKILQHELICSECLFLSRQHNSDCKRLSVSKILEKFSSLRKLEDKAS